MTEERKLTATQVDTLLTLGRKVSQGLELAQKALIKSGIEPANAHAMVVANVLGQLVSFSSINLVKQALEIGEASSKAKQKEKENAGTNGAD